MSYDQTGPSGQREEYGPYGAEAFGGGTITHQIIGPKGCVGFVRDIIVDLTVATAGTTTVPEIDLGISASDFTFGRYRLGTAIIAGAYGVGMHRAGDEQLVYTPATNAGRQLSDYVGHVVLDGGTFTSIGVAGGSYGTVVPAGRIPASGLVITNVVNGTANVARIFVQGQLDALIKVGQVVQICNVQGATASGMTTGTLVNGTAPISAISLTQNYIELSGTTFGGTYTGGGIVNFVVTLTEVAGSGTPGGTGFVRVVIDWEGGTQM